MKFAAYVLPVLFVAAILAAAIRRVRVYDSFAAGAAGALPLLKSLFPYIAAVLILSELFEASGLSQAFAKALSPLLVRSGSRRNFLRSFSSNPFRAAALWRSSPTSAPATAPIPISRAAPAFCTLRARPCFTSPPSIFPVIEAKTRSPSSLRWLQISAPPRRAVFSAAFSDCGAWQFTWPRLFFVLPQGQKKEPFVRG